MSCANSSASGRSGSARPRGDHLLAELDRLEGVQVRLDGRQEPHGGDARRSRSSAPPCPGSRPRSAARRTRRRNGPSTRVAIQPHRARQHDRRPAPCRSSVHVDSGGRSDRPFARWSTSSNRILVRQRIQVVGELMMIQTRAAVEHDHRIAGSPARRRTGSCRRSGRARRRRSRARVAPRLATDDAESRAAHLVRAVHRDQQRGHASRRCAPSTARRSPPSAGRGCPRRASPIVAFASAIVAAHEHVALERPLELLELAAGDRVERGHHPDAVAEDARRPARRRSRATGGRPATHVLRRRWRAGWWRPGRSTRQRPRA